MFKSSKNKLTPSSKTHFKSSKVAVLQVVPSLISGGVERGTIDIAAAINKAGFRSFVASSGGPMLTQLYQTGSKHIHLPLDKKNPFSIIKNAFKLCKIIKEFDIDIVHARSRAPAWSAYIATRLMKRKFVTTFHGIYKINNFIKRFYNSVMTKGDQVIAISNFTYNHILENYKIDNSIISIIPRGADIEYFNPSKVNPERIIHLANKFHISLEKPIIVLPGRLTRWKGQDLLIKALTHLPKNSYNCILVGDDKGHSSYRKELEESIIRHDLKNEVNIIGNISDMPAIYMLADVVVSASIEPEAFGRIAIETQAMGRLIIATNIGGSKETVIENITGWLFEPNDPEGLARLLQKALALNIEERKKIALNAQKHIKENFSLDIMCSKTIKLYKSLLGIKK